MRGPTYNEQLLNIVGAYRDAGLPWPATARQMADWAIRRGMWNQHPDAAVRRCAEDIARAMREEYLTDPQGRSVRAKHAARITIDGEQLMLWEDIRTAEPKHMRIAFQQRRQQIVGDCHQLKTDVDSYNENANTGKSIQMEFDFTQDLAELDAMEETAA